ncbi:hypothetical protein NHQ30_000973 [Ciborinia camelliae]|nr:hypothetical protein NHQ30_000973 [Ciborinia camelliae]
MPNKQSQQSAHGLHAQNLQGQSVFPPRAKPYQPQVQEREVAAFEDLAFLVGLETEQVAFVEEVEEGRLERVRWVRPGGHGGFEEIGLRVVVGQTVARTGDQVEELRDAVQEVEGLGDQQQEEGFGEVPEDPADGEDHAGEITVRVADKDAGRVPVVREQREGYPDEGEEHVQGEEMRHKEERNDEGLRYFDAVYAGENVDAVGAEDGDSRHGDWDDDLGNAKIDKIDNENGNAGDGGDEEFMAPADIEEVVANSEDYYGLEGEDGREVRC